MPFPRVLVAFCVLLSGVLNAPLRSQSEDPPPAPNRQDPPAATRSQEPPSGTGAQEPPQGPPTKELPEIQVIGSTPETGLPQVPMNSVGSRDVYGPEQLRSTGARDLNDLVMSLPGISARPYNGGEAAAPSFSMRGLPDDGLTEYVNVQIDGVPASPMPYGWTAFSFMPVTIERVFGIDFIRGAFATRYSPNTVGGILNFVTAPIPEDPSFTMRTTIGSNDYMATLLSGGGTDDGVGVSGTFVDRRGDGYRKEGGFDQQDANVKLQWDMDNGDYLATSLSYMADEHKAPGGLTQTEFDSDRFGNARPLNEFDGYRGLVDLVYHSRVDEDSWLEPYASLSMTNRHLRAQRPQFGAPATMSDWNDTSYFAQVGLRGQTEIASNHTLYGGIRFHYEWLPHWTIDSEPFPSGPKTRTQDSQYYTTAFSAHLDDTFEVIDDVTLQLGARVEWVPETDGEDPVAGWSFDQDFFAVLPGVGAAWEFEEGWAAYANYFEGFRAPQVWGYAFSAPGTDLDFELGRETEVGVRFRDQRGVSGTVNFWRTEFDDYGAFYSGFYENLGRILAHGVDFIVDWDTGIVIPDLEGFTLSASLTLQDSELKSGPDAGNETPYAWNAKAAWRAGYAFGTGWSASLGGSYIGESYSDEANTEAPSADGSIGLNPAWTIWDARINKEILVNDTGALNLSIGATNLFDKDWYYHSRGGFFGPGLVAGPPLQFYFSMDYTW